MIHPTTWVDRVTLLNPSGVSTGLQGESEILTLQSTYLQASACSLSPATVQSLGFFRILNWHFNYFKVLITWFSLPGTYSLTILFHLSGQLLHGCLQTWLVLSAAPSTAPSETRHTPVCACSVPLLPATLGTAWRGTVPLTAKPQSVMVLSKYFFNERMNLSYIKGGERNEKG